MKDIVVGTDATKRGRQAVLIAAEIAEATGANLHVVSAVDKKSATAMQVGGDTFHGDPMAEAQQILASITKTLSNESVTTAAGTDDPASMLCAEAERLGAAMIVVGNKRVQGAARIMGSIATDVLKNAPCHVLVADTSDADD